MTTRDYTGWFDHYLEAPFWHRTGTVFTLADTTLPSLYWPWLVEAGRVDTTLPPDERWRMYYSTDHHGVGGIAMATAPDPQGPWTEYGVVYLDTVAGASTETPSVTWDEVTGEWLMLYQQAHVPVAGQQSTLLATSPDGITWTRQGVAISVTPGAWPGDGHTGYAVPHRVDGQWIAYHLLGGGDRPHFGMSYSADGRSWTTDPRPLLYGADQVDPGWRIEWNHGHVVRFRGDRWWIGIVSTFGSGAGAVSRILAQAPLAADMRHLLGEPRPLWPADPPANYRSLHVTRQDQQLVLTYQVDNEFRRAMTAWI